LFLALAAIERNRGSSDKAKWKKDVSLKAKNLNNSMTIKYKAKTTRVPELFLIIGNL